MKKIIVLLSISFCLTSFARVDDLAYDYEVNLQLAQIEQQENREPSSIHAHQDSSEFFKMEQEKFWDDYHNIEE